MALPQVPSCSVSIGADGLYVITHNRSRRTATARTVQQAEIQGAILRCLAAYPWIEEAA